MLLLFGKSKWEMSGAPLAAFLQRTKEDGYDAAEIFFAPEPDSGEVIGAATREAGLQLVAQVISGGSTPEEHLDSLSRQFAKAQAARPTLVNSHTGCDVFPLEENLRILRHAEALAQDAGLPLCHETHRGRPTFSGPGTRQLLGALPELRFTADFSHWFCVHESDLSNQPDNVAALIQRAFHIHARVGFEEGPQVSNPLEPSTLPVTEKFLTLWRRIISARRSDGTAQLIIVPEFGPQPYMPLDASGQPVADTWETNRRFLRYLREQLS